MRLNPSDEILTYLYRLLNPLSYDGKNYPVYTVVPKNANFDYVLMAPLELVDDSSKDQRILEATQMFDVVTFGAERGSWKPCNNLSGQIMDKVENETITTEHFKTVVTPIIDSTNSFNEEVEGGQIFRTVIRFRYNIQQI